MSGSWEISVGLHHTWLGAKWNRCFYYALSEHDCSCTAYGMWFVEISLTRLKSNMVAEMDGIEISIKCSVDWIGGQNWLIAINHHHWWRIPFILIGTYVRFEYTLRIAEYVEIVIYFSTTYSCSMWANSTYRVWRDEKNSEVARIVCHHCNDFVKHAIDQMVSFGFIFIHFVSK